MTNKQALLSLFNYLQGADLVLINLGIDGALDYTIENKNQIEIASAYLMKAAYSMPDLKQGDNQVTWSKKDLANTANAIFKKYGLESEIFGQITFNLSNSLY